jgi:hypothetical protein
MVYKKILEYEALAMQYFGRSTLCRLGRNFVGSTRRADLPTELSKLHDHARRSLLFLGRLSLLEVQEHQQKAIVDVIQNAAAKRTRWRRSAGWFRPYLSN